MYMYVRCTIVFTAGGISNVEMEDALSCNDDVLSEVLTTDDLPASDGDCVLRVPALNWLRLKYDVRNYIVVRQRDLKQLNCWKHEIFNKGTCVL